jgi:ABC-2 type transport system ATP-binding protein
VLAEAAQTADHVVIIASGRLVSQSSLADLTAHAAPVLRIQTPDPARLQAIVTADGGHARLAGGDQLEISGSTVTRVAMLAAGASISIIQATTEQASLEDVFLRLTDTRQSTEADPTAPVGEETAR